MQTVASTPIAAARKDRIPAVASGTGLGNLIVFFVAAYALAWLPFGVAILAARGALALPVPEAVFISLATVGIGLAGFGAAALESGRAGLRDLRAQVLRWRVSLVWFVVALLGPALFPAAGLLLGAVMGNAAPTMPPLATWLLVSPVIGALFLPAFFEEIGWRGYALRRLERRLGLLAASLVLGVIWAGVHLPLWLLPDFGFAQQSVPLYVAQVTAISVLLAWLYKGSGGSVLLTGLAHAAINGWPMLWATSVLALSQETRAIPFQVLITAATAVAAVVVVLVTESRGRRAERRLKGNVHARS
jgi:membrane protease YdiL (CAAX protease family)